MLKVLFYRRYVGFTGGHLKVWHYYNHVKASNKHIPNIYFAEDSIWDSSNPWKNEGRLIVDQWSPEKSDIIFLAGTDWRQLPEQERINYSKPIINLVQNIRHVNPSDVRYPFIKNKAVRLCYNIDVYDALKKANANGPVFYIPMGMDFDMANKWRLLDIRPIDVLIVGYKDPEIALTVGLKIKAKRIRVEILTKNIRRSEYIGLLRRSKITLFMPMKEEGYYIPPLEGMAAGTLVICPDRPGVTNDYKDSINCFRPQYDTGHIIEAVDKALKMDKKMRNELLHNGRATLLHHKLSNERDRSLDILNNIYQIW